MAVKIFYDLETTGVEVRKHGVHQIAGLVEVDGEVVEEFDIRTRPHPKAIATKEALNICGVTREQIYAYPHMVEAYNSLVTMARKYVDEFDKTDKIHLIGFNNRFFDDQFLRAWFVQNGSHMYDMFFWSDSRDVMVLASEYLDDRRASMPSFKLKRVAKELGLEVDDEKLHNAFYDVYLTRKIYRIVTFLDLEI